VPSEFRRPPPIPGAEWFTEEVRRQLVAQFGQDATTQGGLMVRTSLDPVLQTAAEKSLRDGLMAYDRKQGGWRGPVTHLDAGAALDRDWQTALAQVARPPGMLPAWRLAVVLGATDQEARIGWIAADNQQPRTGTLLLSDLSWARPVRDGRLGPTPRRVTDVMKPGDVVMIEPPAQAAVQTAAAQTPAATPTRGARPAAPPPAARPVLRQIPTVQGALVSLDPSTGRVFAMVGGWSFEQSQFNRATQAQRQPGSSFKPMVYLTALEKGISPSQRFLDAPIVVDTSEGRWRPGNYEGTFNGPVPLRIALEQSLNLVTLRVAQQVGMDAVADTAIAFHMADSMP
ncbi:MAG: penicillin-binding protein, partial [Rhodospirillales bacterium]|nr:penicillin-binding protein [Rhodospirillales bacterium]